jgi:hypothetical protein
MDALKGHAELVGLDVARLTRAPCPLPPKWVSQSGLSSNYADVGVLNAQWNTSFESLAT